MTRKRQKKLNYEILPPRTYLSQEWLKKFNVDLATAGEHVKTCLSDPNFVRETIGQAMGITYYSGNLGSLAAVLFQAGETNSIWQIKPKGRNLGTSSNFVVIQSNSPNWNDSTEKDYYGLREITQATDSAGVGRVAPQSYNIFFSQGRDGMHASFSVESMAGRYGIYPRQYPHTVFTLPFGSMEASIILPFVQYTFCAPSDVDKVSPIMEIETAFFSLLDLYRDTKFQRKRMDEWKSGPQQRLSDMMTYQIVTLLRTINLLTGKIPANIKMHRGDFLGFPSAEGEYSLRLSTIRDGLIGLDPSRASFERWLYRIPTTLDTEAFQRKYPKVSMQTAVSPLFVAEDRYVASAISDTDRRLSRYIEHK